MNFGSAEAIANAVLFEGYMLYPYRPSARKNQQRWNFGTLFPRAYAERQLPRERWSFATEMVVEAGEDTRIAARVRFLQLFPPSQSSFGEWEQGIARQRTLQPVSIADLIRGVEQYLDFSCLTEDEARSAPAGCRNSPLVGRVELTAVPLREGVYRLSARFGNESALTAATTSTRAVQDSAFTSAHLLLAVEDGAFVSLLEPTAGFEQEAAACQQDGLLPVMAGKRGDRSLVLCSPIFLYDYPQVAAESAGDFFDGTEMDEMLTLRVLTLTDAEKEEMRRSDPHARRILERTEGLSEEELLKLHGAVRERREVSGDERKITTECAE